MRFTTWRLILRCGLLALAIACSVPALAQTYPSQPVRLVIPYAAGGAVDIMGRMLAKEMQQLNGQAYVVENKGGAGGAIAAAEVAHATPDGYTVFIGATGPISIVPAIYGSKVGFQPLKDLAPVSLIATTPYVLVTNANLPVKSVPELIAYAKAHPGAVNYASAGAGGPDHLAGELFNSLAGLSVPHVPYKGSGPALIDLMAGQVQYQFVSPLPAMPLVESGKIRLLAVTGRDRSKALPNVPTVGESLPGFEVSPWYGFFVPAQTPTPIVDKIAADLKKIFASDEIQQSLRKRGLDPITDTPAEFAAFVRDDVARWDAIVKMAKIKPE